MSSQTNLKRTPNTTRTLSAQQPLARLPVGVQLVDAQLHALLVLLQRRLESEKSGQTWDQKLAGAIGRNESCQKRKKHGDSRKIKETKSGMVYLNILPTRSRNKSDWTGRRSAPLLRLSLVSSVWSVASNGPVCCLRLKESEKRKVAFC